MTDPWEVDRVYVCSCFGITESQVKEHAEAGACTPRQIASQCKAGTDCGSCVRSIQSILGRGAAPRERLLRQGAPAQGPLEAPAVTGPPAPEPVLAAVTTAVVGAVVAEGVPEAA